ncbi:MAG: hypothetical protein WAM14_23445 [Candidatus Nitrosopolaris sp.]
MIKTQILNLDPGFRFELANIIFDCQGINSCVSVMGAGGAKVEVNYHWACDQARCVIPPAKLDRIPPQILNGTNGGENHNV